MICEKTMPHFIMHDKWTKRLENRKRRKLFSHIFYSFWLFFYCFLIHFINNKQNMYVLYIQKKKNKTIKENNWVNAHSNNQRNKYEK